MWQSVLEFWFEDVTASGWFAKDADLDAKIAQEFGQLHLAASHCELFDWRATPEGRLAEVILLDQFSRNIFRDKPQAFACDALALALAQEAVSQSADTALPLVQRTFLYMPYMHSESKAVHEEAVRLFSQEGLEQNLNFEMQHKAIIDKFGRYPHRNEILGRPSTEEEQKFLQTPGSAF